MRGNFLEIYKETLSLEASYHYGRESTKEWYNVKFLAIMREMVPEMLCGGRRLCSGLFVAESAASVFCFERFTVQNI